MARDADELERLRRQVREAEGGYVCLATPVPLTSRNLLLLHLSLRGGRCERPRTDPWLTHTPYRMTRDGSPILPSRQVREAATATAAAHLQLADALREKGSGEVLSAALAARDVQLARCEEAAAGRRAEADALRVRVGALERQQLADAAVADDLRSQVVSLSRRKAGQDDQVRRAREEEEEEGGPRLLRVMSHESPVRAIASILPSSKKWTARRLRGCARSWRSCLDARCGCLSLSPR